MQGPRRAVGRGAEARDLFEQRIDGIPVVRLHHDPHETRFRGRCRAQAEDVKAGAGGAQIDDAAGRRDLLQMPDVGEEGPRGLEVRDREVDAANVL